MKYNSEKGFTLIEVIMASVILVVGIGIVGSIISEIVQRNFHSQRHTQAVLLAQNKIEQLLTDGYENPNLAENSYENPLNPVNATGDSNGVFYQFWTIDDLNPIPRSKLITSKVQWESTTGNLETVTLTSVCIDQSN
ncbi:MAG: prepilin-type N-terminal cleavage/methylation domain-containing protein [Candidatus Latescibacteria bacterium]|nr:prepilin-type N-terminal cleavage/methylation domain-containing protein [Candidatus Latescibacterota bacterium]